MEEKAFSFPNIDEDISEIAIDSMLLLSSTESFGSNAGGRAKPEFLEQDYTSDFFHNGLPLGAELIQCFQVAELAIVSLTSIALWI